MAAKKKPGVPSSLREMLDSIPAYDASEYTWYSALGRTSDGNTSDSSLSETKLVSGARARILACSCFGRTHSSTTLRWTFRRPEPKPRKLPRPDSRTPANYLPKEKDYGTNLNSIEEICSVLKPLIFPKEGQGLARAEGLVVVTGATNSGKSKIARGLIHQYLDGRIKTSPPRRPHLVTFEDPIEVFFATQDKLIGISRLPIDYTPRERGVDVPSLKAAVRDALRQTPEVFYMGELRDAKDWSALLRLASTGHLVVTTAHAGSLQEALRGILDAMGVSTPAERSAVASRLLAVIHVRPWQEDEDEDAAPVFTRALAPALWRATPDGVVGMMEYGLSSVLPSRKGSCLGRAWFLKKLVACRRRKTAEEEEHFNQLIEEAERWDLEGPLERKRS